MTFIRFAERPSIRNPWAEFERIRQGLDELSRNYAGKSQNPNPSNVYPPLNIYEDPEKLLVVAELPGVNTEDLDLSLEGDTLTIQGKRDNRSGQTTRSYHRREIESGSFSRAIALPIKVDLEGLSAKLVNGILTITLNKAIEATPRRINVSAE